MIHRFENHFLFSIFKIKCVWPVVQEYLFCPLFVMSSEQSLFSLQIHSFWKVFELSKYPFLQTLCFLLQVKISHFFILIYLLHLATRCLHKSFPSSHYLQKQIIRINWMLAFCLSRNIFNSHRFRALIENDWFRAWCWIHLQRNLPNRKWTLKKRLLTCGNIRDVLENWVLFREDPEPRLSFVQVVLKQDFKHFELKHLLVMLSSLLLS